MTFDQTCRDSVVCLCVGAQIMHIVFHLFVAALLSTAHAMFSALFSKAAGWITPTLLAVTASVHTVAQTSPSPVAHQVQCQPNLRHARTITLHTLTNKLWKMQCQHYAGTHTLLRMDIRIWPFLLWEASEKMLTRNGLMPEAVQF